MGAKKKLERKIKALKKELKRKRKGSAKRAAVSPLAPATFPDLPQIAGARFATARAGVRYKGRTDVMLAHLAPGTTLAGCFTRSATRAASILDAQAKIGQRSDAGAAILVNSGNANAFTGRAGNEAVDAICAAVADALDLPKARVFTASTGVIGEPLPHARITAALPDLVRGLAEDGLPDAARAIMTTDTFPKGAAAQIDLGGAPVRIAGIAKGSGMIAPDMGTMLVYLFTDAAIDQDVAQTLLGRLTDRSFNCITVDSDTSTSDMLLLAATGQSTALPIEDATSPAAEAVAQALESVMRDLAHQVVRDGEGARKFIEITVTGARDDADARRVAMSIANSPLVKTAAAGEDPNWGRIVMAIGKSGAEADRDRLSIRFGPHLVAESGQVAESYTEAQGAAYMKQSDLVFGVDLGLGKGAATVWTCDLTARYIEINADYRS